MSAYGFILFFLGEQTFILLCNKVFMLPRLRSLAE